VLGCRPVNIKTSKLPIESEMTKEPRYRSKTYSVIGNLIAGIDHAAVCQSHRKDGFGGCRMTRWRKSTKEGSIYRVK